MKKCVCCGRETYHKVGEQTVCARCDVDGSFEYHLKKQAAQQSVQLTCATCGDSGRGIPTLQEPDGAEEGCVECGTRR